MKCIFIKKNNEKYEIDLETNKGWKKLDENFIEDIFTKEFIRKIMLGELED